MSAEDDRRFMDLALALSARGLGNVWPNPAVGCVIVAGGRIFTLDSGATVAAAANERLAAASSPR